MPLIATQDVACALCSNHAAHEICRTKDFCCETCENEFYYVACTSCGHVYLKNRPLISELDTIYPQNYLTYDYEKHLGSLIHNVRMRYQRTRIGPMRKFAREGDVIVDVGSGAGDLLQLAKMFGDPSWTLVGIDFSERAAEGLRRRGLNAIHGRFETCEFNFPPAGVIIMNQLIEHVEDPVASLEKSFEILRPGGVVIIETPNLKAWEASLFKQRYWAGWHAPRHWHLFDPDSLGRVGERIGFETEEVASTLNPFSWLHTTQYILRERYKLRRFSKIFDLDNFPMLCIASGMDAIQKLATGTTSNMRVVLKKPT